MRKNVAVWFAVLVSAGLLALSCYAEEDKPVQQSDRQHVVSLVDGTSLVCKPLIKSLPVKTSYADLEIPFEKLVNAVFDKEKKEATVKLANGDVIKGTVPLEKMKIKTLIGEVTISMADILEISNKTAPAEEEKKISDTPENRARCINNLRQLDAAKEQWALANKMADMSPVNIPEMLQYVKGAAMPVCPSGGKYEVGVIGKNPKCSVPGHKLPVGDE